MPATGWINGTAQSNDTLASTAWSNQANILDQDDDEVTEAITAKNTPATGSTTSGWLKVGTFGFDSLVPSGATITQVQVRVRSRVNSTGGIANREMAYAISGTRGTNVHGSATEPTTLETVDTDVTSERSWVRADLLNGTFEVHVRGRNGNNATDPSYRFAYVAVQVTYTAPVEYTDSDTITLALTPSGTEFPAEEYTDSGTVLLALTASGEEYRTTAYSDSGTITLAFTPSGVDEYTPGVTGTEYEDSGTIYLTLTPGGAQLLVIPTLDDFNRANGDVGSAWSGDAWSGSNKLQIENNEVRSSAGNYVTNWWNAGVLGPDIEAAVTIKALPDNGAAVWLEGRMRDPNTGNMDCYHLEYYRYTGSADKLRIIKVTNLVGSQQTDQDGPDMEVGTQLGLRIIGSNPVRIEGWVKQPGEDWALITSWEDSSGTQLTNAGFVSLGIGSTVTGRADDFRAHTIGVADTGQFVEIGTPYETVFNDTFDDDVEDWAVVTGSTGSQLETGGQLILSPGEATFYQVYQNTVYDLTGATVTCMFGTLEEDTSIAIGMAADIDSQQGPDIQVYRTNLPSYQITSTSMDDEPEEIATQPVGLRIRDTGDGWIYQYTLDGTTWLTHGFDVYVDPPNSLYFYIFSYAAVAGGDVPVNSYTVERYAVQIYLTLTPGGTDEYTPGSAEYTDSDTIVLDFTPSLVEAYERVDSGTINLVFTPSGTELREITDAGTVPLTLLPSGVETREHADAGQLRLELTPSGIEEHTTFDAGTANLRFTPSGVEERVSADAATANLAFTPSASETAQFVDSGIVYFDLTPGGSEQYTTPGGTEYTDSATVTLSFTPSGTELQERTYEDSATIPVVFTITYTEEAQTVDSSQIYVTFTPSGIDTLEAIEVGEVRLTLTPSGTDEYVPIFAYEDSGTIYLRLTVGTVGVEGLLLKSRAFLRFASTAMGRWKSRSFKRVLSRA